MNVKYTIILQYLIVLTISELNHYIILPSRIVECFEALISYYAQQPDLNRSQIFTAPSLTVVAELVSIITT